MIIALSRRFANVNPVSNLQHLRPGNTTRGFPMMSQREARQAQTEAAG